MNTEALQTTLDAIDSDERWDTGELGREEQFAKSVEKSPEQQAALDESLGLQMISIRLPKALIEDFKFNDEMFIHDSHSQSALNNKSHCLV